MTETFQARLYRENGSDAEAVEVEFHSLQLKLKDSDFFAYYNSVTVALGGQSGTKLKIMSRSNGWALILDQPQALQAMLQAAAGTALADDLQRLNEQLQEHPHKERKYWAKVFIGIAIFLGLGYLSLEGLVQLAVDRIDPAWEMRFADLLSHNSNWSDKSASAQRVQRVGARLVGALKSNPYTFHYFVDQSPEVNAFAMPGGLVVVNQGLLEKASDDELAGVMAHEIGHVIHRDSLRQLVHTLGVSSALSLIIGATGSDQVINLANIANMAEKLESLSYSRQQEAAADTFGVRLAVDADYRGSALIDFFAKLKKEEAPVQGSPVVNLLSNHPMTDDRIAAIKAELAQLQKEHHKD